MDTLKLKRAWVAERVGWHALEMASRTEENGERKPLLAARILLGLHAYPSDPSTPLGPTKKTLREYFTGAPSLSGAPVQRRVLNLTLRQRIATVEGGYGRGGNQLSGNDKKLPEVTEALWSSFNSYLTQLSEQDARQLIEAAKAEGPAAGKVKIRKPSRVSVEQLDLPHAGDRRSRTFVSAIMWLVKSKLAKILISPGGMGSLAAASIAMMLVGILIAPAMVGQTTPAVAETEVLTYVATSHEVSAALSLAGTENGSTCAPSATSPRQDAVGCMLGSEQGFFADPCFLVSQDRVSCPNTLDVLLGTDFASAQSTVKNFVDTKWSSWSDRVGVEHARDAKFPWMFQLARRSDAGEPYMCRSAITPSPSFENPSFYCALNNDFPMYADIGAENFASGSWIGTISLNLIEAGDLDRTTEPWTVLVKDPQHNTTERVAVDRAWF